MRRIKGPAVFLAQFLRDEEPFSSLASIGKWFAGMGYKGVQVPAWDRRVIDLDQAAASWLGHFPRGPGRSAGAYRLLTNQSSADNVKARRLPMRPPRRVPVA